MAASLSPQRPAEGDERHAAAKEASECTLVAIQKVDRHDRSDVDRSRGAWPAVLQVAARAT